MKTAHVGLVVAGSQQVEPRTDRRSLGWLAVAVALAIVAIFIMGTMAEARWCGPDLCVEVQDY